MKSWQQGIRMLALAVGSVAGGAPADRFSLPAPVMEVVTTAEAFAPLVAAVRRALPEAGLDDRMRLGLEAHLALNERSAHAALAAAAALQALEEDPDARALAGLVTTAQVAAWGPGTSFAHEFGTRLAALPRTPGVRRRLSNLRDKIAATTPEALLEQAAVLGRRLDQAGGCDWSEADEIIRLHHRLANVLPLRSDLLAALETAINARAND